MSVKIDFDVNNLAHILYRSSKCINSKDTALEVAKFLKRFTHEIVFIVTAVFNGYNQLQSKQDSFKRRFTSIMGEINGKYCKHSAMSLSARAEKSGDDKVQLDLLNKEAKQLDTNNLIIVRWE